MMISLVLQKMTVTFVVTVICAPMGIRTPVWALRGPRPGPLDDGGALPKASGIVSSHKSIVNEKGVNFSRSMDADSVDTFDITCRRRTCDEDCGFAIAYQMNRILQR